MPATAAGYVIKKQSEAPNVPCPCGVSTRILTGADGAPCSLHVTTIAEATRHYHRDTTEVYYILEGQGKMELNGEWHEVGPGTVVWIEPGTRHRVTSEHGLKTIVFALPAFNPADEWFD
ncbi:cupin domain-containing protein [Gemmata sp. JC717]|uniref:cupin domain-containing protein n=1 Tax=Gemmata algarum TaxID=2975278 RepID=UPI0021BAC797|nr:cupin domain-containing protein [Gemmata algarum]MDY3551115.1 cupin domain-containing protein [Gemmata algarum]